MSLELEATIVKIMDEQVISDRFKKREFVVQTKEQYPQTVCFELTQDKTNLIDQYSVGQDINVSFNVRGREWTPPQGGDTRYYTSLQAWRITAAQAAPPPAAAPASYNNNLPPQGEPFNSPAAGSGSSFEDDDDLPF